MEEEELYFKELTKEEKDRNRILEHPTIKRMLSRMPEDYDDLEKARYVYINLGKIFSFDSKYMLGNESHKKSIRKYVCDNPIDLEKMKLKGNKYKGICINISMVYGIIMASQGIRPFIFQERGNDPHREIELWINKKNLKKYKGMEIDKDNQWVIVPADLQGDLKYIQTHQHTKHFGINYTGTKESVTKEDIEEIDKKIGYEYDGELAYERIKEEYKKESVGLYKQDKIDLFFRKVEQAPYINELGIIERRDIIKKFSDDMLDYDSRKNLSVTYIYKKDPEHKKRRKSYIPIYSYYLSNNHIRYCYDKNTNKFITVSDEKLIDFIANNEYMGADQIPGLQTRNKGLFSKLFNKGNNQKNNNDKDIDER